jgi:hypothetical protein
VSPEEQVRNETYNRLAEAIGHEAADYVMAHLPPEEWPGLATKADLRELGAEIRKDMAHQLELVNARFDAIESRFESKFGEADANTRSYVHDAASTLRREMVNQTRTIVIAMATMTAGLIAAFAR